MKRCIWLLALWAAVGWNGRGDALTIYRIGGADLPPPVLDTPYKFVQLEWRPSILRHTVEWCRWR